MLVAVDWSDERVGAYTFIKGRIKELFKFRFIVVFG